MLLFNSRLRLFPGKLESKWTRPFIVTQVFPYRAVELENNEGTRFKVKGQRLRSTLAKRRMCRKWLRPTILMKSK